MNHDQQTSSPPMPATNKAAGTIAKTDLRGDRGSILIFVVGILVLLALSATAYLSSSRVDRVATKQNEFNTQVDLLLEGVKRVTINAILNDSSVPLLINDGSSGNNIFSDSGAQEQWLAARVPTPFLNGIFTDVANNQGNVPAVWRFMTRGIFGNTYTTPTGQTYTSRQFAIPTSSGGLPAFQFFTTAPTRDPVYYRAGDADGDGIADSGYQIVPVGVINGITYYASIRIIDNSSAVNANTAFSRDIDYSGTGVALGNTGGFRAPLGMFTSSVGLRELLRTYQATGEPEITASATARLKGSALTDIATGPTDITSTYRSLGDRLYHSLGRRVNDPADDAAAVNGQAALAYRFIIRDPTASLTPIESLLRQSLVGTTATGAYAFAPTQPYPAGSVNQWYKDSFNFAGEVPTNPTAGPGWRPRRSLLTLTNPESGLVRAADMLKLVNGNGSNPAVPANRYATVVKAANEGAPPANTRERMDFYATDTAQSAAAFTKLPYRCSVNTANFSELWRAYWNVMCNTSFPAGAEAMADQLERPAFRKDVVADTFANPTFAASGWNNTDQMLVRAAHAAVNTIDMRDADSLLYPDGSEAPGSVTVKQVALNVGPTGTAYVVNVFGSEKQPFITRVVMDNVNGGAPNYLGVELYNPYDTPMRMPANWRLARVTRNPADPFYVPPPYEIVDVHVFPNDTIIPARGYYVVWDGALPGGGAVVHPATNVATAPGLLNAKLSELVLMRPRRNDGVLSTADDPNTPTIEPNEGTAGAPNLANFVPLDAVPLRPRDPNDVNPDDPNGLFVMERPTPTTPSTTGNEPWKFVLAEPEAFMTRGTPPYAMGTQHTSADQATRPTIQLNNTDWPAPVPVADNGATKKAYFPYGGFARLGDLLEVPFIGSWSITDTTDPTKIVEISPITYDASYARDADTPPNPAFATPLRDENIGRFFSAKPGTIEWHKSYDFGRDLFTFFTVAQHPWDEYFYDAPSVSDDPTVQFSNYAVPHDHNPASPKVLGHTPVVPGARLSNAGPVQGLVNINTAPQKVLAALPWFPPGDNYNFTTNPVSIGPDGFVDNEQMAAAIVKYRDDPAAKVFRQVTDLFDMPDFRIASTASTTPNAEPDDPQLELTPLQRNVLINGVSPAVTVDTDGARDDFEEQTLVYNRVSNLITTRSDSFTVYILLQGYRNGGTPAAELRVERRAAMIVDRSRVSPDVKTVTTERVPTN